jgi:hypothetical protein
MRCMCVYVCLSECEYVSVCVCVCVCTCVKRETERVLPLELELRIQWRPKQLPLPLLCASSLLQHYSTIPVYSTLYEAQAQQNKDISRQVQSRSQLSSNMVEIEVIKVIS